MGKLTIVKFILHDLKRLLNSSTENTRTTVDAITTAKFAINQLLTLYYDSADCTNQSNLSIGIELSSMNAKVVGIKNHRVSNYGLILQLYSRVIHNRSTKWKVSFLRILMRNHQLEVVTEELGLRWVHNFCRISNVISTMNDVNDCKNVIFKTMELIRIRNLFYLRIPKIPKSIIFQKISLMRFRMRAQNTLTFSKQHYKGISIFISFFWRWKRKDWLDVRSWKFSDFLPKEKIF